MRSSEKLGNGQMVLVVAQSAEFAQDLVSLWKQQPSFPAFTVMIPGSNGVDNAGYHAACHLAIVESTAMRSHHAMLQRLDVVGVPIICATNAHQHSPRQNSRLLQLEQARPTSEQLRAELPHSIAISLPEGDAGIETLIVIAEEVLHRVDASARARKAETASEPQTAQLALGKYVADSMHGFNNALTAVLGNAELLMLDAEKFSAAVQEQVEAIHSNALRLHEMMQRFSSLESEMNAGKKEGQKESAMAASQAYLSGT